MKIEITEENEKSHPIKMEFEQDSKYVLISINYENHFSIEKSKLIEMITFMADNSSDN